MKLQWYSFLNYCLKIRLFQAGTEICHQFISGWHVQNMDFLKECVMFTERNVLFNKSLKIGKTLVWYDEPDLKRLSMEGKHTVFTIKENIMALSSVKDVMLGSVLGHENTHHHQFLWKRTTMLLIIKSKSKNDPCWIDKLGNIT